MFAVFILNAMFPTSSQVHCNLCLPAFVSDMSNSLVKSLSCSCAQYTINPLF